MALSLYSDKIYPYILYSELMHGIVCIPSLQNSGLNLLEEIIQEGTKTEDYDDVNDPEKLVFDAIINLIQHTKELQIAEAEARQAKIKAAAD